MAKSIYEDSSEPPLANEAMHDALYRSALTAFDNASNPNRTRGGLRKCNDMSVVMNQSSAHYGQF